MAIGQAIVDGATAYVGAKAIGNAIGKALSPTYNSERRPGFWPGDSGAIEWGKRNDINRKEAKDRFHRGIKPRCHTPGARDDPSTNPATGEVVDANGDYAGNLNNDYD